MQAAPFDKYRVGRRPSDEKLKETDWDEFRRTLRNGDEWKSACIINELKNRLLHTVPNEDSKIQRATSTIAEPLSLRGAGLQLIKDLPGESSNKNKDMNAHNICSNLAIQQFQPKESPLDSGLELFEQYYRSRSISTAVLQWRLFAALGKECKLGLSKQLVIRLFRRWRLSSKNKTPQNRNQSAKIYSSRKSDIPKLPFNEICIRGHEMTSQSLRIHSSRAQNSIKSNRSVLTYRTERPEDSVQFTNTKGRHGHAQENKENPRKEKRISRESGSFANSSQSKIVSKGTSLDLISNDLDGNRHHNHESGLLEVSPEKPSSAAVLYRSRMRLSRLHYHRSLLIDNGWRPWRALIELQHRRYRLSFQFYNGITRRAFWRKWKKRICLWFNSIATAQRMFRLVTCRWGLAKWNTSLLLVTESIRHTQCRRAIRRWCIFVKQKMHQQYRLGDAPRIRRYWGLWKKQHQELKHFKYRRELLQKVHGWLKQDSLTKIIECKMSRNDMGPDEISERE